MSQGADPPARTDEDAIVRLLHDYGHFLDYGHSDEWFALFAPGAVYALAYRDGLVRRAIGCPEVHGSTLVYRDAALKEFAAAHSRAPGHWHKHFVSGWRVDRDGTSGARCTSYFMRVDAVGNGSRIVACGRYLDRLVRIRTGLWRFAERVAEIEMQ